LHAKDAPLLLELDRKVISAMDDGVPSIRSEGEEFVEWLRNHNDSLKIALERFYTASSFRKVLAHLIALDILLAGLLLATFQLRLAAHSV
jgi:hypothetical protein